MALHHLPALFSLMWICFLASISFSLEDTTTVHIRGHWKYKNQRTEYVKTKFPQSCYAKKQKYMKFGHHEIRYMRAQKCRFLIRVFRVLFARHQHECWLSCFMSSCFSFPIAIGSCSRLLVLHVEPSFNDFRFLFGNQFCDISGIMISHATNYIVLIP